MTSKQFYETIEILELIYIFDKGFRNAQEERIKYYENILNEMLKVHYKFIKDNKNAKI